MGIKFVDDLQAWREWAERQNLLRYLKHQVKSKPDTQPQQLIVATPKSAPPAQVLIALEASTPTQLASLLKPAQFLSDKGYSVAVVALEEQAENLINRGFSEVDKVCSEGSLSKKLLAVQQVIAVGHYLPVGQWAYEQAQQSGWGFNVIQHGLNTPFASPLPAYSTLFAFSQADAEFWISGRNDIQAEIVGSQLFYEAHNQEQVAPQNIAKQPVFLGQMHGAELSRASFAQAGYQFCRNHRAIYRPHPSEKDKLSLITHKLWAKKGIEIDSSGTPLNQLNNPVVSVFSTGVLEAAMRGIPAWVYHPNPPAWLVEFWERYGMSQWGDSPTPAPAQPAIEPAKKIAEVIAQTIAQ